MNIKDNKIIRQSNIELLRIISMIMIIAHHFSIHGKFKIENTLLLNNIYLHFLSSWGKIGVNIFVMISGYFLIKSLNIQTKKVLKLLFQIIFYSLLIFILFVGLKIVPFKTNDLINHILGYPIWWFAKSYLALYLLHPYINRLLNNLEKKEYQKFLIYLTILFSFLPTITDVKLDDGSLIWFIYVYSLGGYLNKYSLKLKWKTNTYFIMFLLLYIPTFSTVIFTDLLGIKKLLMLNQINKLFEMEKIFSLLISLFIFLGFNSMNIKDNKIINTISKTAFGIYLIHDSDYIRPFLWETLFKNASYSNTYLLIPYSIIIILTVFIVCLIIDLLRIYLLENNCNRLITNISNYIDKSISKLLNKI